MEGERKRDHASSLYIMLPFILAAALAVPDASSAQPNCDTEPQVTYAAPPVYPDPTLNVGQLKVDVEVTIDATGALNSAVILKSSGYDSFDAAALVSARKSTYKSGLRSCEAATKTGVFVVTFNPVADVPGTTIPAPSFVPGSDWSAYEPKAIDLDLGSLGLVVGSWRRSDETLGLSEYMAPGYDISAERALSFVETRLNLVTVTSNAIIKTATLCNGKMPGEEFDFAFVSGKTLRQASVFVVATHGTVYTLGYTVPWPAPSHGSVPPSIMGFCA
jgi:TonB family protein